MGDLTSHYDAGGVEAATPDVDATVVVVNSTSSRGFFQECSAVNMISSRKGAS